jgi:RNA polymerase sigma-70 factor (ECF subfamily)
MTAIAAASPPGAFFFGILPPAWSPARRSVRRHRPEPVPLPMRTDLDDLSDEELIALARESAASAETCLAVLYRRWYPKVAAWCLRLSGDRQEAADLAQEVFLRVHGRLGSFRGESRFSTWLYTVTRSVVINRGQTARRRQTDPLDELDPGAEPVEPAPGADRELEQGEILAALRQAMATDLDPIEAKVLYLHYVDGITLPALTGMLQLDNKSGAKAYVVSGGRKLKRRFGRWLARQSSGGSLS